MKSAIEYLLIAALLSFLFFNGVAPAWNRVHSDFANYYVSAQLVVEGQSLERLYDNAWFQKEIKDHGINTPGKFSPFPPVTAWMMTPLVSFSPLSAQQIFTLINLLFIMLGVVLLKIITHWKTTHCIILLLGGGLSVVNNISFGQVYVIMTVFILIAIVLEQNLHSRIAGILLGVFSALKYFPVVFVVGYFFQGARVRKNNPSFPSEYRLVSTFLLTIILLTSMQFIFFGPSVMRQFFMSSFLPHLNGELSGQGLYSFQFQSWDNFFRNLCVPDPTYNPHPFIPWAFGKTVFKIVVTLLMICTLLAALYRYKDAHRSARKAVYLSAPALLALVLLPASATYHFVLLIIPIVLLIKENLLDRKSITIILVLYFLIGFIPYGTAFHLSAAWGLFFAYPRLWLVTGIFVIVMAQLTSHKLKPATL